MNVIGSQKDQNFREYEYVALSEHSAVGGLIFRIKAFLLKKRCLPKQCPQCGDNMYVLDANRWRMTGAGLICDICANAPPNSIVASDTHEVLEVDANNSVIFPGES